MYEHPDRQITLTEARQRDPNLAHADFIEEPMESVDFGRIGAQTAKQVIVQKVREAERAQVVEAYKDRVGELVRSNGSSAAMSTSISAAMPRRSSRAST